MKKLLIVMLLWAAPALAEDRRISETEMNKLGRQLSQIDTAYRQGCIKRRERDLVWSEAQSLVEMMDWDWARVDRIGKSYRANSVKCDTARGIVRDAHISSRMAE